MTSQVLIRVLPVTCTVHVHESYTSTLSRSDSKHMGADTQKSEPDRQAGLAPFFFLQLAK